MVVFKDVQKEDIKKLVSIGFKREKIKTMYEEARFSHDDIDAILYTSGKLVVQGHPEDAEDMAEHIEQVGVGERVKVPKFRKETGWMIGSDESLKGDTFGGLVVASVKADDTIRQKLLEIGVNDSKKLQDREILLMAEKIKRIAPSYVQSILPEEYNHNGSVTHMLNKMHSSCAKYLLPGKHVVDKYPGCTVGDIAETKAEMKYVEVAAASVLARAAALKQLEFLSAEAGFTIPKGSTHVGSALEELQSKGMDFRKFVKTSFRNVSEFQGNSGKT